jgi:hypothetical protein
MSVEDLDRAIAHRRQEVRRLEGEIDALQAAVVILKGRHPNVADDNGRENLAALPPSEARVTDLVANDTAHWQGAARAVFSDGKPHLYSQLTEQLYKSHNTHPKTLHVWLTRQVKNGELRKVSRGVYVSVEHSGGGRQN